MVTQYSEQVIKSTCNWSPLFININILPHCYVIRTNHTLSKTNDSKLVANWRNSSCRVENDETHKIVPWAASPFLKNQSSEFQKKSLNEEKIKKAKALSSGYVLMGLISLSQALVPGPGVNLDTRVPLQVVQADPGSLTVARLKRKSSTLKPGLRPPCNDRQSLPT